MNTKRVLYIIEHLFTMINMKTSEKQTQLIYNIEKYEIEKQLTTFVFFNARCLNCTIIKQDEERRYYFAKVFNLYRGSRF